MLGTSHRHFRGRAQADANGDFSVPLFIHHPGRNERLEIEVRAHDEGGQRANPLHFHVFVGR